MCTPLQASAPICTPLHPPLHTNCKICQLLALQVQDKSSQAQDKSKDENDNWSDWSEPCAPGDWWDSDRSPYSIGESDDEHLTLQQLAAQRRLSSAP